MRLYSILKKTKFCFTVGDGLIGKFTLLYGSVHHTLKAISPTLFGAMALDQNCTEYHILYKGKKLTIFLRSQDFLIFYEVFMEENYQIPIELKSQIKTVVDLGAHIGLTSLYYSTLLDDKSIIYAVEPSPSNLNILRKNLLPLEQVKILECAISDKNETINLIDKDYGHNHKISFDETDQSVGVNGITLLKLMEENKITSIDLLKIDIEGSESELFTSFDQWKSAVKSFIIELHDNYPLVKLQTLLEDSIFKLHLPEKSNTIKMIYGKSG